MAKVKVNAPNKVRVRVKAGERFQVFNHQQIVDYEEWMDRYGIIFQAEEPVVEEVVEEPKAEETVEEVAEEVEEPVVEEVVVEEVAPKPEPKKKRTRKSKKK